MSTGQPLILVVDDEPHVRHVVRLKLQSAGFDVLTAENGREGFELAVEHRPQLIFTDYQMPEMSGMEMSTALKSHEATRDLPLVMLTARGFRIAPEELEQTNICRMLSKPFSPRELLAIAQELTTPATVQEVTAPT